jgi:hypothetical protein
LTQRPIPALSEIPGRFDRVAECEGPITHSQWNSFIKGEQELIIPAGGTAIVDIECASLTTAFVNLQCGEGLGSIITFLYSECYEKDVGIETAPFPMPRTKLLRSDSNGQLYGVKDIYTVVDGQAEQTFEPFWFRVFRYVQLHVKTSSQILKLKDFTLRETSYSLDIATEIQLDQHSTRSGMSVYGLSRTADMRHIRIAHSTSKTNLHLILDYKCCSHIKYHRMTDLPEKLWKNSTPVSAPTG